MSMSKAEAQILLSLWQTPQEQKNIQEGLSMPSGSGV